MELSFAVLACWSLESEALLSRIEIHEQTARLIALTLTDEEGTAINLTGKALTFSLAEYPGAPASFSKTTLSGVSITEAETGQITVQFAKADLAQLRLKREGRWQVQIHPGADLDADPERRVSGEATILPSIA